MITTLLIRTVLGCTLLLPCLDAADWPRISGPAGNNIAPLAADVQLVDKVEDIRLLWKSQHRIETTYGTDARKASQPRSSGRGAGSGYNAPLVADGRVFLYYHRPSGDVFHAATVAKSLANGGWGRSTWTALADAVIHCFDAGTGQTLWKRVLTREGIHVEAGFNKGGGHFLSELRGDTLIVQTCGARLAALDTKTGTVRWIRGIGARSLGMEQVANWAESTAALAYMNRSLNQSPCIAGDVVLASDMREDTGMIRDQGGHGLVAYDIKDGRILWYQPRMGNTTPAAWEHAGTWYVLCKATAHHLANTGDNGLACIEARSGKIMWLSKEHSLPAAGICLLGDRMLTQKLTADKKGMLALLELKADQPPKELWTTGGSIGGKGGYAMTASWVYGVDNDAGVRSLQTADGKVVSSQPAWNPEHQAMLVTGDLICAPLRSGINILRIHKDGQIKALGQLRIPIATCTRIAAADGVMYVRAQTRLHAYDLKKP